MYVNGVGYWTLGASHMLIRQSVTKLSPSLTLAICSKDGKDGYDVRYELVHILMERMHSGIM